MNDQNTPEITPSQDRPGPGPQQPAGPIYCYPVGRKRRFSWGLFFLVLMLAGSVFLNFILMAIIALGVTGEHDEIEEKLIHGDPSAKEVVVVIDVSGPLMGGTVGLLGKVGNVNTIIKHMERARKTEQVKAVVLSVDSPGGTVTASDRLYQEVKKLKEADKTVVVHIRGIGASGSYYLSAPADRIIASRTSIGILLCQR